MFLPRARSAARLTLLLLLLTPALFAQTSQPTTAPAQLVLPSAADLAEATATVRKVFAADLARKDAVTRAQLAQTMLQQATTESPALRLALLREALECAISAGNPELALASCAALAANFPYDRQRLHLDTGERLYLTVTTPAACVALSQAALNDLPSLISAERYDLGDRMATLAESAAAKSRSVAQVTTVQTQLLDYHLRATEYRAVVTARSTLLTKPADPSTHLTIGLYECFRLGQWSTGLAHLAQCEQPVLRPLADFEQTAPTTGVRQLELADAWWAAAGLLSPTYQTAAQARASTWYRRAYNNLSGPTADRIRARLALSDQTTATRPGTPNLNPAAGTNLLTQLDLKTAIAAGTWEIKDHSLTSASSDYARLGFATPVPDEYDLRSEFTVTDGDGTVSFLLAGGKTGFGFTLGTQRRTNCRFETVNGKAQKDNPTVTKFTLENRHRYTLCLQVRKTGVRALMDGKELVTYQTDLKDLARYTPWKLPDTQPLGVGAHRCTLTVHTLELLPVSK